MAPLPVVAAVDTLRDFMRTRLSQLVAAGTSCALYAALTFAVFVLLGSSASAQESTVKLDPAQTTIEFTLDSTLHTVHGTFKLKSGHISFDTATGKAGGEIIVDATSGDSDNKGRDKKMHHEILEKI